MKIEPQASQLLHRLQQQMAAKMQAQMLQQMLQASGGEKQLQNQKVQPLKTKVESNSSIINQSANVQKTVAISVQPILQTSGKTPDVKNSDDIDTLLRFAREGPPQRVTNEDIQNMVVCES